MHSNHGNDREMDDCASCIFAQQQHRENHLEFPQIQPGRCRKDGCSPWEIWPRYGHEVDGGWLEICLKNDFIIPAVAVKLVDLYVSMGMAERALPWQLLARKDKSGQPDVQSPVAAPGTPVILKLIQNRSSALCNMFAMTSQVRKKLNAARYNGILMVLPN